MNNIIPYINIHTHQKRENEISIECVGVHPYEVESGERLSADDILPSTQAVGEIGLDFSRPISKQLQEELFEEQLSLAQDAGLPVVIHSVKSFERVMEILKKFSLKAVIFHGFIGSYEQAQRAVERGCFLSFGHRCFNSSKTLNALRKLQLNNIFFETDDYDISIEDIYLKASELRTENIEQIKAELYKNYKKIFNK
ncbi:MAG: TatD family hydrolase [Rikenellaceae bacterium]